MATMVYEYGLLNPGKDVTVAVENQIRLAHKYYNKLIEIEQWRREEVDKIQSVGNVQSLIVQIENLASQKKQLQEEIKNARKISRSSKTDAPKKKSVKDINEKVKTLRASLKEEKRKLREDPVIIQKFSELDEEANNKVKETRGFFSKEKGLYWGTYTLIENAIDQARKSPSPPRFKSWNGEGSIGVQIQKQKNKKEFLAEKVFEENQYIQILPVPKKAFDKKTPRGERKRLSRTNIFFRINSKKGKPVWVEFPMILHRQLPENSEIKLAKILMRKHANWKKWFLQLTINIPDEEIAHKRTEKTAIDLGWRQMDDGSIRIVYLATENGKTEEFRLPSSIPERINKANSIRSIRDKNLDKLKVDIKPYLGLVPVDLKPQTSPVFWKSPGKFVVWFWALKNSNNSSLSPLLKILDDFRKRDKHLWQYETGMRKSAILHRREIYRRLSCELTNKFSEIYLEKWDLRKMANHPEPEDGSKTTTKADLNRTIAGISIFRNCLKSSASKTGTAIFEVNPANSTRECYFCGAVAPDAIIELVYKCENCEREWDQDENASKILFARGLEASKNQEALATKKNQRVAKWKKRKAVSV